MSLDEIYQLFPNLRERRAQPGHQAVGRRAADAGDRPHPAHRRHAAAARRADRRPGAGHRRSASARSSASSRAAASRSCWSSRTSASPPRSADRHYVVEDGRVVDMIAAADVAAEHRQAASLSRGVGAMFELLGISAAGAVRPAAARPDQRRLLRHAEPRPRRHLRHAERHQLHARRAVHDGRLRRLAAARPARRAVLVRRWSSRRSIVGLFGIVLEKLLLKRIYHLDHLYGFLLTFGLALMIEGLFQWKWGSSGAPYPSPIPGGTNLGFMFLPTYRGFVVVAALVICLVTWYGIETHQARRLPARGDREPDPGACLRHQRAAPDHAHLRAGRRRWPRWPACWRRRSSRSRR